jgi:Ras-related and estrogen-regulated growth inhibitor-like protein
MVIIASFFSFWSTIAQTTHSFSPSSSSPIQDFLYKHNVNFEDNVSTEIEILDTCNVSKTVALNLLSKLIEIATLQHGYSYDHIRWADSFLIVYSIVDRESFYEAERILKQLSKLKLPSFYTSLLLGNKSDLEHSR